MADKHLDFDGIFCGIQPDKGRFRIAANGIGWKASSDKKKVVSPDDLRKLVWMRAARGYQLRAHLKNDEVLKFDGFKTDVRICLEIVVIQLIFWNRISRRSRKPSANFTSSRSRSRKSASRAGIGVAMTSKVSDPATEISTVLIGNLLLFFQDRISSSTSPISPW